MHGNSFEELGVRLVAISADTVEEADKMRRGAGYRWVTLLSDEKADVIRRYGLARYEKAKVRGPKRLVAEPTTFLIDSGGIVRWIDRSQEPDARCDLERVLAEVRARLSGQ